MKLLFTTLITLFYLITILPQNYKQVKIYFDDPANIPYLQSILDYDHSEITKDNSLIVFVNEVEYSRLLLTNFKHEVLIENWEEYFKTIPDITPEEFEAQRMLSSSKYNVSGFTLGSLKGNYTLSEVIAKLDTLRLLYPNLISAKSSIGTSVEGRPIYMVKISDNPDINENEPQVLYTGMHHAREPVSMMQMFYFMYYLLENYDTDPSVKFLVDNRELYFIPVVNPDGYEWNRTQSPAGGGMWRKNRKNNGDGTFGVDLNRNYGPMAYWNSPLGGSSTSPSSDTYRGTAPFSEPELVALRDFIGTKNFKNVLNYHTYSNLLIYPYGALQKETPDSMIFREFAADMTVYNNYTYGTDLQTVNYSTRGNSDDYMYDGDTVLNSGKLFAMTPEVGTSGDGFWPPVARIMPLVMENLHPNLYYAWVAGGYVQTKDVILSPQYISPGDIVGVHPLLKNKGLGNAYNVQTEMVSLSEYAIIFDGTFPLEVIPGRTDTLTLFPFGVNIAAHTPIETELKFEITNKTGNVIMSVDTITVIVGIPTYTFIDTTNSINNFWTVTATPSTPKWEETNSTFHSSPNSYTDSKTGQYVNNATVTLQTTNNIDLTGYQKPRLSFWAKWDIETKWDCGVVMVSTNNGSTWTAVAGNYTKPASGSGKQTPAGMPIYDGIKSSWVKEEINLSQFGGQQIKIKFELRTDSYITKDGWYLDDIGVFVYTAVPVELSSFNAAADLNSVMLNWVTASELNNYGFEIQKAPAVSSPEEIKDWHTAAFIKGAGTTNEVNHYSFVDENPFTGKSYYRLKQVDLDGTFRLYDAVAVEFLGVTQYSLEQNFPNPFNPVTRINFALPKASEVSLKIYNLLGSEVAELVNEFKEAGRYSFDLNSKDYNLSSGVYFYSITAGEYSKTLKMMILK
jgi:carboxypeptidase T